LERTAGGRRTALERLKAKPFGDELAGQMEGREAAERSLG